MATVKNLRLELRHRPEIVAPAEIGLRHFAGPDDIGPWLAIRNRAFAREKLGVGQWDAGDFQREFLAKPWWSAQRMWLAQSRLAGDDWPVVGTVTW
ncbi:MAG TPA: hypothetical protein VIK18_17050, partial [Pirellulales bacterium]